MAVQFYKKHTIRTESYRTDEGDTRWKYRITRGVVFSTQEISGFKFRRDAVSDARKFIDRRDDDGSHDHP